MHLQLGAAALHLAPSALYTMYCTPLYTIHCAPCSQQRIVHHVTDSTCYLHPVCGASSSQQPCLLLRWRMGKGSTKKKPKWKSLELETPPATTSTARATTTPEQGLDPQHPFLKMINKNVDGTVISTEKQQQANEGSKPIHLYRSSRHLGVPPSAPSSQYVGAPIQYCPTKWVDQTNQHVPPQEVLLQTAVPEVVYPPVATAEVISEVVGQEMYQQIGSQEVYQHPVVYQQRWKKRKK